ncbi:MAG: hypothetical protein U5N53_28995 [Mycobacterium sp.]|nr:hypothetical protein [Mycobacterium sp.]
MLALRAAVHSVSAVIAEYLDEAGRYAELNRVDLAKGLRRQAEVLRSYVC